MRSPPFFAPRSTAAHLMGFYEVGSRSAIGFDDAFREQVPNCLVALGHVGGENVVEAAIFTDDHDDVFNRRGGLGIRLGLRC